MQSENFDNKVRQAAEQHHPGYDEKAWTKMEKLLDQHLPQKGNRRRSIIFLLLLFLLAGGGAWLVISKPWQQNHPTLATTTNTTGKNEVNPSAGSTKETAEVNSSAEKKDNKETITIPVITTKKEDIQTIEGSVNSREKSDQNLIVTNGKIRTNTHKDKVLPRQNNKTAQLSMERVISEKPKKDKTSSVNNTGISSPGDNNNDKVSGKDKIKAPVDQPAGNDITKNETIETKSDNIVEPTKNIDKKDIAKKSNNKKRNSFFFSLSAGPDVSSIGLDNPGKTKLLTGAGFGYTFKDRLTVRTGFYSSRKVYSATRYDYKPTVAPPNSVFIDNIAADCKVFEIPLSVAYNFSQSKNHSLFVSTGLSSYIMKSERYAYLYKYPNGSTYSYTKAINNEYRHYFSVLTLSAGYQHKINRTFSITAEPYFKMPLAGVGYGKIKLNSAGVLFSVNISPFQSAAKK